MKTNKCDYIWLDASQPDTNLRFYREMVACRRLIATTLNASLFSLFT